MSFWRLRDCTRAWERLAELRRTEGAELLEFALVLPMLAAMVVGISDFGAAWALKDKLTNAARDGARTAVSQPSCTISDSNNNLCGATPPNPPAWVSAVRDVVANYLTNAQVTTCTIGNAATSTGPFAWQYTSSTSGCGAFLLKIERGYTYTSGSSPTVTVGAARVTLSYPFSWSIGRVLKLMTPSSNLGNTITINTAVVIQNLT
ncbi:MAG: TadE/TadG family type IV pilus assembly protein [Candidatus Acidiferrales bacterium]